MNTRTVTECGRVTNTRNCMIKTIMLQLPPSLLASGHGECL